MTHDDNRTPADRYADLPEETRDFIEQLRPKDIALLTDAIEFMRSAKTMGRFAYWALALIVGTFLTMVAAGEGIKTVTGWFKGG